jgi:hypothetical protein
MAFFKRDNSTVRDETFNMRFLSALTNHLLGGGLEMKKRLGSLITLWLVVLSLTVAQNALGSFSFQTSVVNEGDLYICTTVMKDISPAVDTGDALLSVGLSDPSIWQEVLNGPDQRASGRVGLEALMPAGLQGFISEVHDGLTAFYSHLLQKSGLSGTRRFFVAR